MVKSEEKLLAACLYIVSFIFPIIGPLVIWLIKKDESSFIDYHGKEYFNFFISYTIYCVISGILTIIFIGIIALWVLGIAAVVFTIIAAIKAYEGQEYRFPWIFRLIQ